MIREELTVHQEDPAQLKRLIDDQALALAEVIERLNELQTQVAKQSNYQEETNRLVMESMKFDPLRLRQRFTPQLFRLHQHGPKRWKIPPHYTFSRPRAYAPLISIVTPSYNQAQFLPRTINSVLDQEYPNLEYIVQDGGSKDGSADILRRFDNRLTRWCSARDRGQTNAINLGFAGTTGEIMAWLNSDDLLLPGALNYVAHYFEKHPDVDVIYGSRYIIDENDLEIGRWMMPPHDDAFLRWVDYVPQETLFWRREIWERAGGKVDESFDFAMDWDLLLRFQAAGAKFACLPRYLGAFRVTENTKTTTKIKTVGKSEVERLRFRSLGFQPTPDEVWDMTKPYLRKHMWQRVRVKLRLIRSY